MHTEPVRLVAGFREASPPVVEPSPVTVIVVDQPEISSGARMQRLRDQAVAAALEARKPPRPSPHTFKHH